jgi:hypothetical protein
MRPDGDSIEAGAAAVDPYRPPADPTDFVDTRPPHSRLAIASFLCGAVAIAAFAVYVATAAYIGFSALGGDEPIAATSYVAIAGMLVSAGASAFGTGLGIASLFQRSRRRVLGVLGLAASGLVFGFYLVVVSITIAALASVSRS